MWAGLAKVVAEGTGARLGNMNPRIYTLGAMHDAAVTGLRDVTAGTNTYKGVAGFAAVSGYDQATGWGSADMATFAAAYPAATATPTPVPTPVAGPATFTPKRLLFLGHKVGTVSGVRFVKIANPLRNKSALVIGSVDLIGSNFAIDSASTTCNPGVSVARGAHCRIGVRFVPGTKAHLSATLQVTDSASTSPHLVQVYDTGT